MHKRIFWPLAGPQTTVKKETGTKGVVYSAHNALSGPSIERSLQTE
jgi:hypothetical protein